MLLRETRPEDLEGVIDLEVSEDTEGWLGATGREWHVTALADPDQRHLVFVKAHQRRDQDAGDEELVGFVVLAGAGTSGALEMRRMVISPIQRGKGYGRQLLGEVLKLVQDLPDRDRVWLDVHPANDRAVGLYESVGFERCDVPDGVEPAPDLVYMCYEL